MALVIVAAWLLVASGTAAATTVYWTPAHELAPQGSVSFITRGDLDGDGDDDVSSGGFQYWNDGDCPGPPVWRREPGVLPWPSSCPFGQAALGDLDGDGDLDAIVGCFQPGLYMFWNVGTPQIPEWRYDPSMFGGRNYAVPRLADLDDDDDLDLVLLGGDGGTWFRKNTGTPQAPQWGPWVPIPMSPLGPPGFFDMGDLDGDGDLDIVRVNEIRPLQCWENVGTPQAWSFVENPAMLTGVNLGSGGTGIALPDVDCDGDPDLLVAGLDGYGTGLLYLNESVTSALPTSWGVIKALYR